MKYKLANDDDGHWYIYPVNKKEEVVEYFRTMELYCLGESDFEPQTPECMKAIDGPHRLTFKDPIEE